MITRAEAGDIFEHSMSWPTYQQLQAPRISTIQKDKKNLHHIIVGSKYGELSKLYKINKIQMEFYRSK